MSYLTEVIDNLVSLDEMKMKKKSKGVSQKLIKNILIYTDVHGNEYKLHVGENKGMFFMVLKTDNADHSFATVMYAHKGGYDETAKLFKDTVKGVWDKVKDKGENQRGLTLRTALNDLNRPEKITWKIEK